MYFLLILNWSEEAFGICLRLTRFIPTTNVFFKYNESPSNLVGYNVYSWVSTLWDLRKFCKSWQKTIHMASCTSISSLVVERSRNLLIRGKPLNTSSQMNLFLNRNVQNIINNVFGRLIISKEKKAPFFRIETRKFSKMQNESPKTDFLYIPEY